MSQSELTEIYEENEILMTLTKSNFLIKSSKFSNLKSYSVIKSLMDS